MQFTKRTNDPKLQWLEMQFKHYGIECRRQGESWHAPILQIRHKDREAAGTILRSVDDIPDDDPRWNFALGKLAAGFHELVKLYGPLPGAEKIIFTPDHPFHHDMFVGVMRQLEQAMRKLIRVDMMRCHAELLVGDPHVLPSPFMGGPVKFTYCGVDCLISDDFRETVFYYE